MSIICFDASALVKRYSMEPGTALLNALFQLVPARQMSCSVLCLLEVLSILVRKRNDGRLSVAAFDASLLRFNTEIIQSAECRILLTDDQLLYAAADLIGRHNVNAADAVVLRGALVFQASLQQAGDDVIFWTSDNRLARAAKAEGVIVFNPEVKTIARLQQLI